MTNTTDLSDYTGNIIAVTELMGEPIQSAFRVQGVSSVIAVRSGPKRWRLLDIQEWPGIPGQDAASVEITGWKPASVVTDDAAPAQSEAGTGVNVQATVRGGGELFSYPNATHWAKDGSEYQIWEGEMHLASHSALEVSRIYR